MKSNAKLKGKDQYRYLCSHLLCHHDSRCYAWIYPDHDADALCISSVGRWNTDDVIYDKGG